MTDKTIFKVEMKTIDLEAFHFKPKYEVLPDAVADLVAWVKSKGHEVKSFTWKVQDGHYSEMNHRDLFHAQVEIVLKDAGYITVSWGDYVVRRADYPEKFNYFLFSPFLVLESSPFNETFQEASA